MNDSEIDPIDPNENIMIATVHAVFSLDAGVELRAWLESVRWGLHGGLLQHRPPKQDETSGIVVPFFIDTRHPPSAEAAPCRFLQVPAIGVGLMIDFEAENEAGRDPNDIFEQAHQVGIGNVAQFVMPFGGDIFDETRFTGIHTLLADARVNMALHASIQQGNGFVVASDLGDDPLAYWDLFKENVDPERCN